MSSTTCILLLLAFPAVLLPATASRAADDPRPPLDREAHETVKTATFALG